MKAGAGAGAGAVTSPVGLPPPFTFLTLAIIE